MIGNSRDLNRLEYIERLWADEQALDCRAAQIADACTEHLNLRSFLRIRLFWIFGNVEKVAHRDKGSVRRIVGYENSGEVGIGDARPMKRPIQSCAIHNLLGWKTVDLVAILMLQLHRRVGGKTHFIP